MKNNSKKQKTQEGQSSSSSLPVLFPDTAGIDIGSKSHFVAVPSDRDSNPVREFSTFTADLHKMVNWLKECNIKTIIMESTGVFWIPAFELLWPLYILYLNIYPLKKRSFIERLQNVCSKNRMNTKKVVE
jgi:hypothetical protein